MRPHQHISLYAGALAIAMLVGCGSTPTQESTGEYVDDTLITTKVKAAIFNEPTLKSGQINVETFKGTVQLSGFVADPASIDKASEVAGRVDGVKSITNDIRTR